MTSTFFASFEDLPPVYPVSLYIPFVERRYDGTIHSAPTHPSDVATQLSPVGVRSKSCASLDGEIVVVAVGAPLRERRGPLESELLETLRRDSVNEERVSGRSGVFAPASLCGRVWLCV